MQLYDFTTITSEDGSTLVRARARIADHPDRDAQSEWIELQFAIDEPTVLNGAILRSKVLHKAHEILFQLARDFEHAGRQFG